MLAGLPTMPFGSDYDPLEVEPTRARPGPVMPSLNPLPVDERPMVDDEPMEEVTQNPTNPFIRSKLATYAYGAAPGEEVPSSPGGSIGEKFADARRALAEGNTQRALDACDEAVTQAGGTDSEPVLPYLSVLEKIYEAVIGPYENLPQHGDAVTDLDPRAAFMLSRIDGSMCVDDLLDVSGMPRLEAMRVLALLIRHGAVVTR
jgi:hypothetical protein